MATRQDLLEALSLPGEASRTDEDIVSISSGSTSSAKSISLDDPTTAGVRQTAITFARRQDAYAEQSKVSRLNDLHSPSTVVTELTSAHAADSRAPTARTSLSSHVPSLALSNGRDSKEPDHSMDEAMTSTIVGFSISNRGETESRPSAPSLHRGSTTSSTSSLGRKIRPDSLLVRADDGPLILGIALIDFNHSVGPRVEMAYPLSLEQDEELCKLLPWLALPDGAHQSSEDYSYFHVTLQDSSPRSSSSSLPETVFGISCNRQISAAELLEKDTEVSRSTVQKSVVVLASKPLFGLVRDRLGVVTNALFNQRDFRDTHILVDFCVNLERSMKSQLTESGLYMGTNLRELIHKFRHRTLILLKLLMLQKKIMFFGHPVELLCTYQYSLVSLIPNLLLALEDAASPNLDRREHTAKKPTELRTSDRASLMRYLGLPLNIFGRDAFFQPYLPLQQVDMLKTQSWLCGTTNDMVSQQKDALPDLLVNIELNTFEFKDPKVERLGALTAADRRWMDDIVRDVNEEWNDKDPSRPLTMQFKGSDDYLRAKFEDYVCSALASVKYADYLVKSGKNDLGVVGSTGDENCIQNFGELWIQAFRTTNAYTLWNKSTDPALFDICEPRHPCESKPTIISDIGLQLAEGLYELKVAEKVAPAREVITNAIAAGSTGLFRAFEGVRSEVAARIARQSSSSVPSTSQSPPSYLDPSSSSSSPSRTSYPPRPVSPMASLTPSTSTSTVRGLRPLSLAPSATAAASAASTATEITTSAGAAAKATISSWGNFIAKKAAEYKKPAQPGDGTTSPEPLQPAAPVTPRTPSLRSPPLGLKGALWSFGERGEQVTPKRDEPT